jgi:flagellar protein FliO/FliZ
VGADVFDIIMYFFAFSFILVLAYFTSRYLGQKTKGLQKGQYLHIIDAVQLGLDSKLLLLKVDQEYVLLSVSGKNIQMLKAVEINEKESAANDPASVFKFKEVFEKYLQSGAFLQKKKHQNNQEDVKEPFESNLLKIQKLKSRLSSNQDNEVRDVHEE